MGPEYALALAAGLVAAVNPCGFALLPAYLTFLVTGDGATAPGRRTALARALAATAAMTGGFVAVFGVFGLAIVPLAGGIGRHLPWVTIGIGLLLVALGGWLLAGRELPGLPVLRRGPRVRRSAGSMALFGVAYGIASLGCTLPPFVAVVATTFRSGRTWTGVGLFVAYAVGMGLVVGTVAMAVALARMSVVRRLRQLAPAVSRVGGALLVVAGAYVAYYGWYSVRVFAGTATSDPVVDRVGAVQEWFAGWLDRLGPTPLAVAFGVLLAAAGLLAAGLLAGGPTWRKRLPGRGAPASVRAAQRVGTDGGDDG